MVVAVVIAAFHPAWFLTALAVGVLGIVAGAPDGGAGGGAADGADPAADGDGGEGGAGGEGGDGDGDAALDAASRISDGDGDGDAAARGDDDPDDGDDDDRDVPDEVKKHPKFTRMRTDLRRTQRFNQRMRPIVDRFRDALGQIPSARDIDRVFGRARDMEDMEEVLHENPDILNLILERKRGGRSAAAAEPEDEVFQDPFADPDKIPWDTTTESGRALTEMLRKSAKENHELRQELRRVSRQVGDVSERDTARTLGQIEHSWKQATIEASKQVPEYARRSFVNAVRGQFEVAKRDKTLNKLNAARIIQEELAPFIHATKGQQRKTAAGQQQRAEGNRSLPRPAGQGRTTPAAPAESDKSKGTIRDGRKSFFARMGMTTPPAR